MDATYECLQVLRLHGNNNGTIQDTVEITSGDVSVYWNEWTKNNYTACLKFVPTASSDNLSVTFTINLSYAQTNTGAYWCCGIYDELPTNTKIASPGDGRYFKFGLNRSGYGDKVKTYTFTGDFQAGHVYWLVVGMASFTAQNTGKLLNPNDIVLTAVNVVAGDEVYIYTDDEYAPYDVFAFVNGAWVPYDLRLHDGTDWGS